MPWRLKLFAGIESFRNDGRAVLHPLRATSLTHGGVATAHDPLLRRPCRSGIGRGGLAIAAVVACAIFAALSGSSPATVVAIGSIIDSGDGGARLSVEILGGRHRVIGALGILTPPSIVMVLCSLATGGMLHGWPRRSTDQRGARSAISSWRVSCPAWFSLRFSPSRPSSSLDPEATRRSERASWRERWVALADCFWRVWLLVGVVMGGIYGGDVSRRLQKPRGGECGSVLSSVVCRLQGPQAC